MCLALRLGGICELPRSPKGGKKWCIKELQLRLSIGWLARLS